MVGAHKTFGKAKATAALLPERYGFRSMVYGVIFDAQAEAGDVAEAKKTVAWIYDKASVYLQIARIQAERGDLMDVIESIANAGKISIYAILLEEE